MSTPVRRAAAALVAVAAMANLTACGEEEVPVDDSLKSTPGQAFALDPGEDGLQSVVGHGVILEVPAEWEGFDEQDSFDGTTYEWAVAEPDRAPAPAYVQFSMGKEGKGAGYDQIAEATKSLAATDSTFELLDEGEADIAGAERAKFLRFEVTKDNNGTPVELEQLQLYLDMPGGQVSTVRFIAPKGEWDAILQDVYDSLVVAESDSA